jgi:tetratricopeptide (TPR) repeat protein
LDSYCVVEEALAKARRMEDLGVKTWATTADQVRILYHSFRGESAEVKTCAARVERSAVQGAQTSQAEVFWPVLLLRTDVLVGDPMAARRRYVELDRRSAELPSLKPHAEAARAAYFLLRGNVPEAISRYEKLLPSLPIRKSVGWETMRSSFAKALNAAGEHARAKAIAEEVVSNMIPADHEYVGLFLEAQRQLALAESGLGNHVQAAALLDALLAQHGHKDSPLLVGLLHQARAEVAQRANDRPCAEQHLEEMERRFRSTKNPILIAQCDRARLESSSRTEAPGQRPFQVASTHVGSSAFMSGTIKTLPSAVHDPERISEALDAADEPFQTALEFLVNHTKAKSAHLYVRAGDELELAWSSTDKEPSPACKAEFDQWLSLVEEGQATRAAGGKRTSNVVERSTSTGHRLVALQDGARRAVLGGVILEEAFDVDLSRSSHFFDKLGRIIEEREQEPLAFITA